MKFHYEFEIKKLPLPINHQQKILLVGSCFTENIGEKLDKFKFRTLQNPNGILFNPVSVAEAVTDYVEGKAFGADELFFYNEAWHSWKHHSRYSSVDLDAGLQQINESTQNAHQFLQHAEYIFITLGSSWVYHLTETAPLSRLRAIAANNHKAPAEWFYKRLMPTDEIISVLDNMIHRLFLFNPYIKIIFTISPVRHLREGVIENNRSKAGLIQAVHHLVDKFDRLYYFPAYELVIDDLRDYRFYAEDLVHPNYAATQYVWEKLVAACMSPSTQALMNEIHSIQLAYQHKPFNAASAQHRKFLENTLAKTHVLMQQHSYLDFTKELIFFKAGLQQQ